MKEKKINDLPVSPSGNFITACRWENINNPRWDENVLVWKFLKSISPNEPIYGSPSKMNIKYLLSHNLKPNEYDLYYSDIEYSPDGEYILGVGGIPSGEALLSIWDARNEILWRLVKEYFFFATTQKLFFNKSLGIFNYL